jgi:TP901 family phage tail tape measure protein
VSTLADLLIKIGMDTREVTKAADGVEGKLSKTWKQTEKAAKMGGAAIGLAAAGALTMALTSGMETEVAVDKLVAQKGAMGKEAANLGEYAGNLWNQGFGQSMDEVTGAVDAVTSSFDKLGKEGVEKTTGRVMNLAKAFDIDVSRAAQVAGQVVKSGFAKDATQALDLLTHSMQQVPANVREDIMDAADEYGPFLASIGITGQRGFGLLTKAAEKGMFGIDKTGDALKEFTIRATDMSAASKVGFDALGLSQKDMARELLKGGDAGAEAFEKIVDGLIGIKDPVEQSQAALALFGTPLEDLNVSDIPKFLSGLRSAETGMDDAAGAVDRLGQTLNDNAASKIEVFKRQLQSAFMDALAKAIPYVQQFANWIKQNADWLQPLAIVLGIVAVAIWLVVAATTAFNAVMAVNPVTWIVLAIVALVAALVYVATKTKFFQTVWAAVWGFMKTIGNWFAGPFVNFFKKVASLIVSYYTFMWRQLVTIVKGIVAYYRFMWNMWSSVVNSIINKAKSLVSWFQSLPGRISGALSGLFSPLWSGFRRFLNRVIGGWNSLQFSIPGFSFAGISVPGVSMGVPRIPYLADGGITTGPTLAMIGEGREDEAVIPLSRLPEVAGDREVNVVVQIVPGGEKEFRTWINKTIRTKGSFGRNPVSGVIA